MTGYVNIVARAMAADTSALDQVAANLANVNTAGYKRTVPVAQPFLPIANETAQASGHNRQVDGDLAPAVRWDLRQGPLQTTRQPLDLTILGDGFFEVITDQGVAYTRLGKFTVDAHGRLVTQDGHALNGSAGPIRLETSSPEIKTNGQVFVTQGDGHPDAHVGTIKVVRFEDPQNLQPAGRGLWVRDDGVRGTPVNATTIQQGALEGSNVETAAEMVRLMQVVRHFESMQKIMQSYDDVIGAAIKKLGEV